MDRQGHASHFVIQTGLENHQKQYSDPDVHYLSIENKDGELSGYFILVHEANTDSVEFRRILIDENQRGIGQLAISEMERFCRKEFAIKRIWLDVFEDNQLGIHVYEKLGYKRFKQGSLQQRTLFYYEKSLS